MSSSTFAVYRRLTALGEADASDDAPPRSDEALWQHAAKVAPDLYPAGELGRDALADLRGAYDEGRKPNRIDLQRLAQLIRDRGIPAHLDSTFGGQPVLYAGEVYTTMTGEQRHAVAAGPGHYHGDTAYADRNDFHAGPDDDGAIRIDDPVFHADPEVFQSLAEIADAIVALTIAETDRNRQIAARLDAAMYDGWMALWQAVAAALPETEPGEDGLPDADDYVADRQRLLELVREFVDTRAPNGQIGPVRDDG